METNDPEKPYHWLQSKLEKGKVDINENDAAF